MEQRVSSGFGNDVKEQVKQATDIVDLVGGYLQLRRQGRQYVCHCPWHDDQRPSLTVDPARQSWVCWVCNIRGDVFDFVMRREGVEFLEALKILAERAGIPLTLHQTSVEKGSVNDKQTLYRAMAWAEQEFHHFLLTAPEARLAREYLADRKIGSDEIAEFRLGFCPPSFTWVVDRGRSAGFSPEILEAVDLVGRNNYGSWYDRFRGRLLFPIRDTMNRCIALGGRIVPGVFPKENEPPGKYINSRETRLFSKSDTLYGLNLVRDEVAKTRSLTIVEGYTDVVGAWQAGLRDVVACLGTALNERHIRLIKRFADRITLVLDGDEAGQKRAAEVLDLFVANDVDMRILTLPESMDPFDFFQKFGADEFRRRVETARDAIEHKILLETRGIDLVQDTHRANQALENILATLARLPTNIFSGSTSRVLRQDQLLVRLARRFHVEADQLRRRVAELRSKINRPTVGEPENGVGETIRISQLNALEKELLQLVIHDEQLLDLACEQVTPDQFVDGPLRQIYEFIGQCFLEGTPADFETLMLSIEDTSLKNVLDQLSHDWQLKQEMALSHGQQLNTRKLFDEVVRQFNEKQIASGHRQLIGQMEQGGLDEMEEQQALEALLIQARQRHGLTPPMDG